MSLWEQVCLISWETWIIRVTFNTVATGPAHAVYFGTYEIVKEAAGGNKVDGRHHPLAAGRRAPIVRDPEVTSRC